MPQSTPARPGSSGAREVPIGEPRANDLHELIREVTVAPDHYPAISYVMNQFILNMNIPGGWCQFYEEIASFAKKAFGVDRNSSFNVVLRFNELVMPDDAILYPVIEHLEHDVLSYVADRQDSPSSTIPPLNDYPGSEVVIEDKYMIPVQTFA